jgi:outer membrane protein assembly factor BamB
LTLDVSPRGLVIGSDGTIYASVSGRTIPIVAVDPTTGARRWSFEPPQSPSPNAVPPFSPSIAVGPEGNVYVAYTQGAFYALG